MTSAPPVILNILVIGVLKDEVLVLLCTCSMILVCSNANGILVPN